MLFRTWTLAVLLALWACVSAWAAPATVQLRVEGQSATLFEGPVTTDGHAIDGKDGTGPHPCDGTNGGANPSPGPTITSALDDSSVAWEGQWFGSFSDFLVNKIDGEAPAGSSFWGSVLNFQPTSVGGCQQQVQPGDEALFALGTGSEPFLELTGPSQAAIGEPVTVSVSDAQGPVAGSSIAGASGVPTGPDGSATFAFDSPGVKRLKAEKAGSIRSNSLFICVPEAGAGSCQSSGPVALPGLAAPAVVPAAVGGAASPVRDSRAPSGRISAPGNGRSYRRGPRVLSGSAADAESGVGEVKLALRRHVRGHACRWWSGRRERFVGSGCRKVFFFAVGGDADWSYLLPGSLPAGHYVLDVKVLDRARNTDERFERGRTRVVFDVLGRSGRPVGPPGLRGGGG